MIANTPPLKAKSRTTDKREEVLDIASETFLSKGYDGTSINVMAREAGISKESIYRYFGSKEDLFLAVVERELEVYRQGMQETASNFQGKSMREALSQLAEKALSVVSSDRTLALRRLVFHMAANGSRAGNHYYASGPEIAYQNLLKLFEHFKPKSAFTIEQLGHHFIALLLHRTMLQRECGVQEALTPEEIRQRSNEAVDTFLKAFCGQQ